jgi:phosphoglycerate kinase
MDLDKLKTTAGLDLKAKRVIVRADLNVPVKDGKVTDATRLERLVPGLQDLARRGARVVVISHFGRPKGGPDQQFTLKPVADKLGELLAHPVVFAGDCVGEPAERTVAALLPGQIAVLENLRFHKGEEKNDPEFAKGAGETRRYLRQRRLLAAHRAHASTEAIARLLPAYAGPLMMEEIDALVRVLEKPARPTAAVIGGAKVSSKIAVLTNLAAKVDMLIIGGAMANTFFLAEGVGIGKSLA